MAASQRYPFIYSDEYLAEDTSAIKIFVLDGDVYVMVGASDPHVTCSSHYLAQRCVASKKSFEKNGLSSV